MNTDSFEDLRLSLRTFAEERDWDQFHSPKNLACALSVEAAELLEHFIWLSEAEVQRLTPSKKKEIAEEVGDVLLYLIRLSDKLGIDPTKAAVAKLKVNARKYPVSRVKGSHKKYTEY